MRRIEKLFCVIALGSATWLSGVAKADDKGAQNQGTSDQGTQQKGRQAERGTTPTRGGQADTKQLTQTLQRVSTTATVEKVDTKNRRVSLKDDSGKELTVEVPSSVKDLKDIKEGDKLKIDYFESVGLSLKKQPGTPPAATQATLVEKRVGKTPSGTIVHSMTGTVEVTKIDRDKHEITVKTPDGKMQTIDVSDPALQSDLANIKEGDKIQASYTEAAAITVMNENEPGMRQQPGQPRSQQPSQQQPTQQPPG